MQSPILRVITLLLIIMVLPNCSSGLLSWRHKNTKDTVITDKTVIFKNIKHMDLAEALYAVEYYRKNKDEPLLIKALERVIALSTDFQVTDKALLELANLQLKQENLETAQKLFKEYNTLYPGSKNREQSLYKEILANYKDLNMPSRDQSKTQDVINLIKIFLEEFPHGDQLAEVRHMLEEAYLRLIQHELLTINFYTHKYSYEEQEYLLEAAKKRILFMAQEFLVPLEDLSSEFGELYNDIMRIFKREEEGTLQKKSLYNQLVNMSEKLSTLIELKTADPNASWVKRLRDRF